MTLRTCGAALSLGVGIGLAGSAAAQGKPKVVIIPTQYFAADPDSARAITQGLREQYERQGYVVIGDDKAQSTFESMGLKPDAHYPDSKAVQFGASAGADLVVYPRLLALGLPAATARPEAEVLLAPAAVLHVRVYNVHTEKNIFFRQIAHEFTVQKAPTDVEAFRLPQAVATATAQEVMIMYFDRGGPIREEIRITPRPTRHIWTRRRR
jgi:hypothetical protein